MPSVSLLFGGHVDLGTASQEDARTFTVNDKWRGKPVVFGDTGGVVEIGGVCTVPNGAASGFSVVASSRTRSQVGSANWEFEYRLVANTENLDQATSQQNLAVTTAAAATQHTRTDSTFTPTAGNFTGAANKSLQWLLRRRGDTDTIACDVLLDDLQLRYT